MTDPEILAAIKALLTDHSEDAVDRLTSAIDAAVLASYHSGVIDAVDARHTEERGPIVPPLEVARVGALLSRDLPPGSWVEWVETVDGEEVWYSAGNEGTPRLWYRRRWMEVGSEHLLRWVRSIGRLVTAGSDPDPTSRGPITGGGS